MASEPNQPAPALSEDDLLRVCCLLQQHPVKHVLVGACACGLHGMVRATQDIDLLVEPSPENLQRVIDALSELWPSKPGHWITTKPFKTHKHWKSKA